MSPEQARYERETADYAALFLTSYAAGHVRGCPQAIPELRTQIRTLPCRCAHLRATPEQPRRRSRRRDALAAFPIALLLGLSVYGWALLLLGLGASR